MSTFKDIQVTGNANIEGDLNVEGEINKLQRDYFMDINNYTDYLTMGDIGGGTLKSCNGVKYGRVVTLFIQFNAVKQSVVDKEIFRFKDQHLDKYAPASYAVFPLIKIWIGLYLSRLSFIYLTSSLLDVREVYIDEHL